MSRSSLGTLLAASIAIAVADRCAAQEVSERVMPNGVRIWDFPDDDANRFSIAVMVGVGARDEVAEHAGIAHFLEHALFLATPTRPNVTADDEITARGIGYNGYTTSEVTTYYLTGPADEWQFMVEWLADHVLHPRFDPVEVEAERRIVLQEIATNGPDFHAITFENLLYGNHPIARSIGGSSGTVGDVKIDDLRAFHGRHYHAANLAVGFCGRVATAPCMDAIEAAFAALRPGEPRQDVAPTQRTGDLRPADMCRPGGLLALGYHLRCTQPDQLRALLVATDHLDRRFHTVAREERQLAYAPSVELEWSRDAQRLEFDCPTADRSNLATLAEIVDELVAELATIDDDDVEQAVAGACGRLRCTSAQALTQAMQLATWVTWHGGRLDEFHRSLTATTAAEVTAAGRDLLLADKRYSLSTSPLIGFNRELWGFVVVWSIVLAVVLWLYGGRMFGALRARLRRALRPKGAVLAMPKPQPKPQPKPTTKPAQPADIDAVERDIQRFFAEEDRSADGS